MGLAPLSESLRGDTFEVCDLGTHGVEGCAEMLKAMHETHYIADCAALGIMFLVAAITGGIAAAFVKFAGASWRAAREHRLPLPLPRKPHTTKEMNNGLGL
jgi:hypothetical protein